MITLRSNPIDAVLARMRDEIDTCQKRAASEVDDWRRHAAAMEEIAVAASKVAVIGLDRRRGPGLTESQADEIEAELRRLESDPAVTKTELRLFLQHPMPCGHAAGNLLTCDAPPFGCNVCNADQPNEVQP